MITYGYITDASLGRDSIFHSLCDLEGIDSVAIIDAAVKLFDADPRTANLAWRPELSEVHLTAEGWDEDEVPECELHPAQVETLIQDCLQRALSRAIG